MIWLFGHVGKQLDKKGKVNFQIYDVTDWKTNNYNTENEARRVVLDHFLFFLKKVLYKGKASGQHYNLAELHLDIQ